MHYRDLGDGLTVSAIGIGCMPMIKGGNITYGAEADLDEATRTLHQAIDMGVASRLTGQNPQGRTRLPVNRKLPLYSIDGGLQLPPQVDQLMFVVNE